MPVTRCAAGALVGRRPVLVHLRARQVAVVLDGHGPDPDWIPDPLLASCLDAGSDRVRVETLAEGRCVQTLHVGSYDDEGPVIERLHAFAAESGLALTGRHHEIYLSDPRRVAPEKLRTILRQPVTPSS